MYNPHMLHPLDYHIVPRPPMIAHGFHSAEASERHIGPSPPR